MFFVIMKTTVEEQKGERIKKNSHSLRANTALFLLQIIMKP